MNYNQNDQDQQKLYKNMIEHLEKEYLEHQNGDKKERNNSYVFLENNTLHLLINLITMLVDKPQPEKFENDHETSSTLNDLSSHIDVSMEDSKKSFEEVIHMLKDKNK